MHHTSIENIHKVTDSLFLDDPKAELDEIEGLKPNVIGSFTSALGGGAWTFSIDSMTLRVGGQKKCLKIVDNALGVCGKVADELNTLN